MRQKLQMSWELCFGEDTMNVPNISIKRRQLRQKGRIKVGRVELTRFNFLLVCWLVQEICCNNWQKFWLIVRLSIRNKFRMRCMRSNRIFTIGRVFLKTISRLLGNLFRMVRNRLDRDWGSWGEEEEKWEKFIGN